jgi:hypothetical protein
MPSGSGISAAQTGIVAGVTGQAPRPGEDLVFDRQMPRNAILIQHADSSFALYQNVRAAGLDSGSIVLEYASIAKISSGARTLKLSISHPGREDYAWQFVTRRHPKGADLDPGEVYLRSDSEVAHPTNAVTQIYTADAGSYRKTSFRRGETVRLHTSFAFPVHADVQYAFRYPDAIRLVHRNGKLSIDRKSSHYALTPDETRRVPGNTWTAYLQFEDQVMDSIRFAIQSP